MKNITKFIILIAGITLVSSCKPELDSLPEVYIDKEGVDEWSFILRFLDLVGLWLFLW